MKSSFEIVVTFTPIGLLDYQTGPVITEYAQRSRIYAKNTSRINEQLHENKN